MLHVTSAWQLFSVPQPVDDR